MVEKETIAPDERPKVAAVIYNRLKAGMPLGIDATIRYGLDVPGTEALRVSQLESDNPYNTRNRTGLPPTPIANPGLASMQAAAQAKVNYFSSASRTRCTTSSRRASRSSTPRPASTASAADGSSPCSDTVSHSLSPRMQNAAFAARGLDLSYAAFDVPGAASRAPSAASRRWASSARNVTAPHKQAVAELVGSELPSVNTLVFRGGDRRPPSTDAAVLAGSAPGTR